MSPGHLTTQCPQLRHYFGPGLGTLHLIVSSDGNAVSMTNFAFLWFALNHISQTEHIEAEYVTHSKLTIIGSGNGLSPGQHQALYLNQSWNIVNCTFRNKLQWNSNRNSNIFIQENAFENVVRRCRPSCLGLDVLTSLKWKGGNNTETERLQWISRLSPWRHFRFSEW